MNACSAKLSAKQISATAADWVARRAAGLSPEDERVLSRWLAADPRHQSAFAHHADAFAAFDRPRATDQVPQFVQEVASRVKRRQRGRIQTAAAALALVIGVAAIWQSSWRSVQPAPARYNAVVHKPETRKLPDGSLVELKAGTEIAVNFSDAFRRVMLHKGGAHFQVIKDSSRPFVVSAAGVETRAVGTAFSVQLENREVEVIVTEGRVAVVAELAETRRRGGTETRRRGDAVPEDRGQRTEDSGQTSVLRSPPSELFVDAGRRLVMDLADDADSPAVAVLLPDELAERLAWRSPRLEFTDTPLAEAVALMNRETSAAGAAPALRLVIDSSSRGLAEEPVSGFFRADRTEAFVRMIEITLGLQSEKRTGEIVLYRKR